MYEKQVSDSLALKFAWLISFVTENNEKQGKFPENYFKKRG